MHEQGWGGVLRMVAGGMAVVLALLVTACRPSPGAPPAVPWVPPEDVSSRLHEAPVLRIEAEMHTAPIRRIDVDAAERFVVTASHDKTARVWDVAHGRLLQVLRPRLGPGDEGKLYAVAMSPDGTTVATAGWSQAGEPSHNIYLFDRASGRLLRRLAGLPNVILHLAFSPDGHYLAAALWGGQNGIRVYDVAQAAEVARDSDYGDSSYWVEFDRQGRLLTSCYDGLLRLYDAQFRLLTRRQAPGGQQPFAARFSPDGTLVAVGFDDTTAVNVLSAADLTWRYAPDTTDVENGNLGTVAWSRDGQRLYAGGRYDDSSGTNLILQWSQAGRGPATRLPGTTNTLMGLRALADGRLLFGAQDPALGLLASNGTRVWTRWPETIDTRAQHAALRVSYDGSVVEFCSVTLQPENRWQSHTTRVHLAEGKVLHDPPPLLSSVPLRPPRTTGLAIRNWEDRTDPTLDDRPLPLRPYETSYTLAITPNKGHFLLGTAWYLRLFQRQGTLLRQIPVPSVTTAVNFSGDGRLAVAAFGDGTLRWYRLSDGEELLALFVHPDGQRWVLWTPEGFFQAAPGAETLIGYHLNQGADTAGEFVAVGQLYDLFSRPDLVARRLEGGITPVLQEALGRIGNVRQVLAAGLPPVLELRSPAESRQDDVEFTLQFAITPRSGGVGGIVYSVNNAKYGDPSARPADLGLPYQRRPLTLLPGRNEISVTAFSANGKIESTPIKTVVHVNAADRQPSLYVLALGISSYRDHSLNLKYAAQDAQAMVAMLRQQGTQLFKAVAVHTLLDSEASLSRIEATFRQLADIVQAHDVFVLYLAGHGAALDGEYHFLSWDLVYSNQQALHEGSVHQSRFRQWLGPIKAQKSLFLLDTCYAGALQMPHRGLAEKGAIDRLMRATGRATIAASTAQQLALEGHEEHGVFTYTLLQGLRGSADGRGNGDGHVSVDELAAYVADEVPRLTLRKWGYEQFPMRQIEGQSFLIRVVQP